MSTQAPPNVIYDQTEPVELPRLIGQGEFHDNVRLALAARDMAQTCRLTLGLA